MRVYVVWDTVHEEVIGAYSSADRAVAAIERIDTTDDYDLEYEEFVLDADPSEAA